MPLFAPGIFLEKSPSATAWATSTIWITGLKNLLTVNQARIPLNSEIIIAAKAVLVNTSPVALRDSFNEAAKT